MKRGMSKEHASLEADKLMREAAVQGFYKDHPKAPRRWRMLGAFKKTF